VIRDAGPAPVTARRGHAPPLPGAMPGRADGGPIGADMPNNSGPRARMAAALGVALLVGCWGDDVPNRVPVDGMVIFGRKVLDVGSIQFDLVVDDPKNAFHSGASISKGQFRMTAEEGLLPGRYKVKIHASHAFPPPKAAEGPAPDPKPAPAEGPAPAPAPAPDPRSVELIPARYNIQTVLAAEIKPGWFNSLTFVLDR